MSSQRTHSLMETLEGRQLMSAALATDGTLNIIGGSGSDQLEVSRQLVSGTFSVYMAVARENGITTGSFNLREVKRIVMFGGLGNDTMQVVGDGLSLIPVTLFGQQGNDILISGAGPDRMVGGGDWDEVRYTGRTTPVKVWLDELPNDGANNGAEGDNVANDVEAVRGGSGDDLFIGNADSNTFYGEGGGDDLRGLGGIDYLFGGDGEDKLLGGTGMDNLHGGNHKDILNGDENDDFLIPGPGNDVVIGGTGNDHAFFNDRLLPVNITLDNVADDGVAGETKNIKSDVEIITGSDSTGVMGDNITGFGDDNTFYGGKGNDQLFGGGGADMLYGGDGTDLLDGGAGGDWLYGGAGDDALWGQGEADMLFGQSHDDDLYGGTGTDKLDGGDGLDGVYGGDGVDQLTGGTGADRFLDRFAVVVEDSITDYAYFADALVTFSSGVGTVSNKIAFAGGTWTQAEIEGEDRALALLHRTTRNTRLLKLIDGRPINFIRQGAEIFNPTDRNLGGWNETGTGRMYITDNAFDSNGMPIITVVIHEIGHNFDEEYNAFAWWGLSGWTKYVDDATDKISGDGLWAYNANAQFVTRFDGDTYARNSAEDDFACTFEVYFMLKLNPTGDFGTVANKLQFIDQMLAALSG